MKISDLFLTYVFVKGIDKLREKGKKKESKELSPTAEKIVDFVTIICGIVGLIWIISVLIWLFS